MTVAPTFKDALGNIKGVSPGTPLPVTDAALNDAPADSAYSIELQQESLRYLKLVSAQIEEAFGTTVSIEDF